MSSYVAALQDGRRIPFSLKRRDRDTFWRVQFKNPDPMGPKYLEKSTKEASEKRAVDSAIAIIRDTYFPKKKDELPKEKLTWEYVKSRLKVACLADNLRERTVEFYSSL